MKKTPANINLLPVHVKAYRFVEKYIEKNIVSPEMSEISKAIDVTVRHTYRIIDELEILGYLKRKGNVARSVKIAKPLK